MNTLHLLHQTHQHLTHHNQQAHLTGGSLRNLLLGEPTNDWDIITDGNVPELARTLADKLGGHYAHLHHKASRIIIKQQGEETTIDLTPLNGNTIQEDLHQRDFTINAIAAPLAEIIHHLETDQPLQPHLIDPLNGLHDIHARRLKAVNHNIFQHDPLRMLRAIRLKTHYQLSIEPETENLIKRHAHLLPLAAPERIHDELYTILEPDGATDQLRYLDTLGLLTILIPEFIPARDMRQPSPHHWDVLEHSLETVGALERLAAMLEHQRGERGEAGGHEGPYPTPPYPRPYGGDVRLDDLADIQTLLHEAEQQSIFQLADLSTPRMKLAALLHDIGKPLTYTTDDKGNIHFYDHPQAGVPLVQQIMTRLSASTQDRRLVQLVAAHHMRPGQLARVEPVTPRAMRRYFVDLGPTGIHIALFSLADHLATLGPQPLTHAWERHLALVQLLLTRYILQRESILPPRLLSPEELMRRLKLEPGPLIGQLLEHIAEAQAEGRIHSKEEALWLAEEKLQGE